MKRILFITAFTPSKFSAGQNFSYNLLNELKDDFKVDVVYFQYADQLYDLQHPNVTINKVSQLSPVEKLVNCILFPIFHPFFSSRFSWIVLLKILEMLKANKYQLIYFDFSQVFVYSLFIRSTKVLMSHDVIYQKYEREKAFIQKCWIYVNELILFSQRNISILSFSSKDEKIIQQKYGIRSNVVRFYISDMIKESKIQIHQKRDYFCFYAAWGRAENSQGLFWFLENVIRQIEETTFLVIGSGMSDQLKAKISEFSNVQYLGFIDNPFNIIANSKALIAPIFKGAGVKVKVIESLACGTSVIGTSVALEGIDFDYTGALTQCEKAQEFVIAINSFKTDNTEKMNLKQAFLMDYETKTRNVKSLISNLL